MMSIWLLWLLLIAAYDFHHRRVPNWLVLLGATLGMAALALAAQPFGISWSEAALGAAAGFGVLVIFYTTGVMGAGDVKFAGALGLWVGLQTLLPIWIGASLLAGGHAVLWMTLRRWPYFPRLVKAFSGASSLEHDGTKTRKRHIPFAAYLALASMGWLVGRNHGLF